MPERLTRKRIAALQTRLAPYGVSFTRGRRGYAGLFSLYRNPPCVTSSHYPMIHSGLELIEQAEREPASLAYMLARIVLDADGVELVAFA
jgi:hypothetical protein